MPRTARVKSKTKIYHIMFRGNELRDIFLDVEDKKRLLHLLYEKATDEGFTIYAYCLMNNHVHILLTGEHESLGRLVKRINTSYVYYFNQKWDRVGHLFHDRYKSQPVETDAHLLAAVRYIHNNPVKAGMVNSPLEYQWSSYRNYVVYPQGCCSCLDPSFILMMFADDIYESKKQFILFSRQQETEPITFMDVEEHEKEDKDILGEAAAEAFVKRFLKMKRVEWECLNKKGYEKIRRELIVELRSRSNLSIRQIASVLGVNRGIVQRVKV